MISVAVVGLLSVIVSPRLVTIKVLEVDGSVSRYHCHQFVLEVPQNMSLTTPMSVVIEYTNR